MTNPNPVKPSVYIIAKTQANTVVLAQWLTNIGVKLDDVNGLMRYSSDLIPLIGKRCYMSYDTSHNLNIKKVRKSASDFITNILATGHGSVLEQIVYNFAIENVSRVFTAEFNRHRAGMAVSEGSMRFIRTERLSYVIPPSLDDNESDDAETRAKKARTRLIFQREFKRMQDTQDELAELWDIGSSEDFHTKKKLTSLFRRLIGMGVATGGIWSGNLRALRHIFTMRCDPAAEEEICLVAVMMLEQMIEAEPDIFGDFKRGEDGYYKPLYKKV